MSQASILFDLRNKFAQKCVGATFVGSGIKQTNKMVPEIPFVVVWEVFLPKIDAPDQPMVVLCGVSTGEQKTFLQALTLRLIFKG